MSVFYTITIKYFEEKKNKKFLLKRHFSLVVTALCDLFKELKEMGTGNIGGRLDF